MKKNINLVPNTINKLERTANIKSKLLNKVPLTNLDGLPNKENKHLQHIAKKELTSSNKKQSMDVKAVICTDTKKLLCLDIIVIITLIRYIHKYLINPFIYQIYSHDFKILITTLSKYKEKYSNSANLYLLLAYITTLLLFFSFENYQFQNIGIIMLMNLITSIAVEANQLLTGAIISGIIAYAFIRIRSSFIANNADISKCARSPYTLFKNTTKNIFKFIGSFF